MNNPFSYEPHPLCIEACRELQEELSQRNDWREEIDRGKMFGVLIVEADNSKIGYLRAYSGQIGGRSDWEGFVPAVFDYLQPDGYFKKHEAEISEMNQQIRQIEANETLIKAKSLIDDLQQKRQEVIANYQTKIKEAKEKRDARRQEALSAGTPLSEEEEKAMIKESQFMKAELKRLKKSINEKTAYETLYENYEKDLKSAAVPVSNIFGSEEYVKVKKGDWEKIIDAFSRAVSRNKLLEKYEKKIVALEKKVSDVSGLLDKMKQFISNRELGEALAEFVKSLEPKTMKERLTEKQKVVKEQTQQKSMHTQEHGTSRKDNISTEL